MSKYLLDPRKWNDDTSREEIINLLKQEGVPSHVYRYHIYLRTAVINIHNTYVTNNKEEYVKYLKEVAKTVDKALRFENRYKQLPIQNMDKLWEDIKQAGIDEFWYIAIIDGFIHKVINELKEYGFLEEGNDKERV